MLMTEQVANWFPAIEGRIVALTSNCGDIYVATERSIYRLRDDQYQGVSIAKVMIPPPMPDPI